MRLAVLVVALGPVLAPAGLAQDYRVTSSSRQRVAEPDVTVEVSFAVGRLQMKPGPDDVLYRARLRYDADAFEPVMRYDAGSRRVRVGVEGRHGQSIDHDNPEQRLDVELSPTVPASVELHYGAGVADLELGGLSLTRIDVKAGAAESVIRFSAPNRVTCETLTFQVGAINLQTEHLGNAGCRSIEFKGAAGDITLDFTGAWPENSTINADLAIGLASLTLRLPESAGVSMNVDRFLASFDQSGLRKRGTRYYSANYDATSVKLDFRVSTALGNIELEWVK